MFDQIRQAAFEDEMKKIAGEASEAFGSLASISLGGSGLLPLALGALSGPKNEEEMAVQNKKGISNVLLPWLGAYRMGRRIRTGFHNTSSQKDKAIEKLIEQLEEAKKENK